MVRSSNKKYGNVKAEHERIDTENKLKKLFDYQRFEKNKCLETMIREAESRFTAELSDEVLTMVSAAGEIHEDAEYAKQQLTEINNKK